MADVHTTAVERFVATARGWDWHKLQEMFYAIGDELRDCKGRFQKGDLLERVVAAISCGTLKHVDRKGHDLLGMSGTPLEGLKVECKTIKPFYKRKVFCKACGTTVNHTIKVRHEGTAKHKRAMRRTQISAVGCDLGEDPGLDEGVFLTRWVRDNHTKCIRLVNTLGNASTKNRKFVADIYLLYADDGTVAVASRSAAERHAIHKSDCITAKFPVSEIAEIRSPQNALKPLDSYPSYEKRQTELTEAFVDEVLNLRNAT